MKRGGPARPLGAVMEGIMTEAKSNSPEDVGFTPAAKGAGFCSSCKAPIYWAEINGKPHPVNRELAADGNVVLWKKADGALHGRVLKKAEQPPAGHPLRKSHFATCPQSKAHRRSR